MSDEAWSFSLRGGCGYAEDEDSMEAADSAHGVDQMTDETLVNAEVDLSSREDSAHFESNPWTIAKLNAFNRARTFSKFKPTPPHPTPELLAKRMDVSDPQSRPGKAEKVKLEHETPICDLELVRTTPSLSRDPPKVTTSASSGTIRGCSDGNTLPRDIAHKDDEPRTSYTLQLEGLPLPKRARLPTYPDTEKIPKGPKQPLPRQGPARIPKVSSPLEAQPQLVFGARTAHPIHQKSPHALATITEGFPTSPRSELQSRNDPRPTRGWKSRTISTTPKTQNTSPTAGSQAEYGISISRPTPWNCVNSLATPDRRQGSSVSQILSLSPSKPTRNSFLKVTESHMSDVSLVDKVSEATRTAVLKR
ncbi:hypothetical protein FS837_009583 [Tulasnella sp. UAMH 9824]|nr:hypothetical protein FS837_009583 [Tulasnella sp. UAMH 9824]